MVEIIDIYAYLYLRSWVCLDTTFFHKYVLLFCLNLFPICFCSSRYLEKNPQHWHPNHNVVVKEIENVNKIKMGLYVCHTMNFQDFGEKNKRRTELVIEIKKIFEELNIRYNLLPQAVHLLHIGSETTNAANKWLLLMASYSFDNLQVRSCSSSLLMPVCHFSLHYVRVAIRIYIRYLGLELLVFHLHPIDTGHCFVLF